jgi:hypothetical protein
MARTAADPSSNDRAMSEPASNRRPDATGDPTAAYIARVREIAPALAAAGAEIDRRRELP